MTGHPINDYIYLVSLRDAARRREFAPVNSGRRNLICRSSVGAHLIWYRDALPKGHRALHEAPRPFRFLRTFRCAKFAFVNAIS